MENLRKIADRMAKSNARGVAILEFSLIVVLFVMLLLAFLDFAHYALLSTILTRSAQHGLALAGTLEQLQKDFINESTLPGTSTDYAAYVTARNEVINAATAIPLNTLFALPGLEGAAELTTFKAYDEYRGGGYRTVTNLNAALLRPGDDWYSELQGKNLLHPSVCSQNVDASCVKPRVSTDTMASLLRSYPIIVMVQARKRSFFPGRGVIPITGMAVGWVQEYPKSPFDIANYLPQTRGNPTSTSGGSGGSTSGDHCTDIGHPQPPECVHWNSYDCKCCDAQGCPSGEHWEIEMCSCTTCPYTNGTCPNGTHFVGWKCYCDCNPGTFCPTNDPGVYYCEHCTVIGGTTGPGS